MSKRKKKNAFSSIANNEETQEAIHEEESNVSEDSLDESQSTEVEEAEIPEELESTENVEESSDETPEETPSEPEIQTQELVYLGISEKGTVTGKVTGQKYSFYKDEYGMPKPTTVDERDTSGILALRGKACCGKDPNQLFMTKTEWDVEINSAKLSNR